MILFDTNVLIAGIISSHLHHGASHHLVQEVHRGTLKGIFCTHSLAECFAILSSYPLIPTIPPESVETMILENVFPYFEIVELTVNDYRDAIRRVKERRLRSGAIYDALIYQAAVKKKAKGICTWDVEDFARLADPGLSVFKPDDHENPFLHRR